MERKHTLIQQRGKDADNRERGGKHEEQTYKQSQKRDVRKGQLALRCLSLTHATERPLQISQVPFLLDRSAGLGTFFLMPVSSIPRPALCLQAYMELRIS